MRKVAATIALILFLLSVLMFFANFAHAATTGKKSNAFGAITPTIDPNVTVVAAVLDGNPHRDADGRLGINLRLHPKYTYGLFDEDIMFCGNVVGMFDEKTAKYQALTYRRQASRLIDGVPCHQLIAVDDVKDTQEVK